MTDNIKINAKTKWRFTKSEALFRLAWTFYSCIYVLFYASELSYKYNSSVIMRYTQITTIMILLSSLFLNRKYRIKEFLKYIAFLLMVFLIEINVSDRAFLVYILFMISAQKIDLAKLIKFDVKLKTALLIFVIFLCEIGYINNYAAVINGSYKQALGFSHPNTFCCFAYTIILEWLCIHFKKAKWRNYLLALALFICIYAIGGGRTSSYTFLLIYFLFVIAKITPKVFYSKISSFIFTIITPLMAFMSFLTAYLYSQGNTYMTVLNELMSYRIGLSSYFMDNYDIKLFGQEVLTISTRSADLGNVQSLILDCAYIRCILVYGAIYFSILIVMYIILLRALLYNKQIEYALFALFFVILGVGESYMLNPLYNISMLFVLGIIKSNSYKINYQTRSTFNSQINTE